MPDTPKSFEEPKYLNLGEHLDAMTRTSLPPQTAAVPARQDAAPEKTDLQRIQESYCSGSQTSDDFDEAGIRAERPNVTEGGVGELPERPEWYVHGNHNVYYEHEAGPYINALERQRDLAIAQRDEVRKEVERLLAESAEYFNGAEDQLAASAGFKAEELERLKFENTDGEPAWVAFNDGVDACIARLRSLPSEPQDGNRKAAENG